MNFRISIIIVLFFWYILTIHTSCEFPRGTIINSKVYINVIDSIGNNLLDSTKTNSFNEDSIKIYRLLPNGNLWLAQNEGTDCPNGFSISHNLLQSFMSLEVSSDSPEHQELDITRIYNSTTYIHWNNQDTDTIYTTIYHNKGQHFIDEVYYNGRLMIEGYKKRGSSYAAMTIVKDR